MRQSSGYGPFANPFGPYGYNNYVRFYETDASVLVRFSADGVLRELRSVRVPVQTNDDLGQRIVLLPDRPPLCTDKSVPKVGLPGAEDPQRLVWSVLQPAAFGMPDGQTVSVESILDDGPIAFATGKARDLATQQRYWFVARLPQGSKP